MYKILLCCVSGVTTNKLVNAVKESAKQKDIKVMCWEEMVHGVIPCALINDGDFASMNGDAVLNQALDLIKK